MRRIVPAVIAACMAIIGADRLCAGSGPDRYADQLQPLVEKFMSEQEVPGLAMAIVEDDRVAYAHGFGVMDLARKSDVVTPRSLFHMASITKLFVATSVMQLVEQGKIDLDAPVVRYLPYFRLADERYRSVTVRQFITHTSGMPDTEGYDWDKPQYDADALERYVRSLADLKLIYPPGEQFRYSNIAFEVLGAMVAQVSGESFEDYVQHHILTPLGMRDSTLLVRETDPKLMTWGHELDSSGDPVRIKVYPYNRMHTPSSNLHSNAVDMARWVRANLRRGELDGKRILNSATYDLMWKPAHATAPDENGRPRSVGISWFLSEYRGHAAVGHSGGDDGYATDLLMIPEKRIGVVWMCNCDWVDRRAITAAALDTALGLKPQPIVMKRSVAWAMYLAYRDRGIDAAIERYGALKKSRPELYDFGVGALRELGWILRDSGHQEDAIRAWQLNAEMFPQSPSAFEDLAAGYEAAGNRALAIENYEKALKLDPKLKGAAEALGRLKEQKK